jgi:hypothetical protein
LDKFQQQTHTC